MADGAAMLVQVPVGSLVSVHTHTPHAVEPRPVARGRVEHGRTLLPPYDHPRLNSVRALLSQATLERDLQLRERRPRRAEGSAAIPHRPSAATRIMRECRHKPARGEA
jgi:hypothetical protein